MSDIVRFSADQFLHTTEPYDYLVSIESATERDHEVMLYRKFAAKACGISAATFKAELRKAEAKLEEQTGHETTDAMTEFTGQPLALRCPGYVCNDSGVWVVNMYGPVCVCPHPIMPVRRITNYETGERKTEIAWRDKGRWHTLIVPRSTLASRTRIVQTLSDAGAYVDSENCAQVVTFFTRMETANADRLKESHSAGRMGWIDGNRFLPYESDLMFDGDSKFAELYAAISQHGDRSAWFELAGQVRRGRSVAARMMMAASFASVLVRPLKVLPFFVHCWSDVSATGKTVALMLAASVWADPNEGAYVRNLNTTNVGVEMLAGFLSSLPLCLDELCLKDKKDGLEELIYSFCEGVGRARGSRTGGIQRQQRWHNCAITTGETPITSDSSRAGAVNRVVDLEVDGPLFDDPRGVADTIRENYGWAGREFVQALLRDSAMDEVRRYYEEYRDRLSAYQATAKQVMTYSVLLAADRFAAVHVFDDTYNLSVSDIAHGLKSDDDVDTNRRAYDWLMGTVAENNFRFEPTQDNYNGPVWGKLDESADGTVVCIIKTRLAALMKDAGYNDRSFVRWAKRAGILVLENNKGAADGGRADKAVRLSSLKEKTRCICVRMNAFDQGKTAPDGFAQVEVASEDLPF